MKKKLLTILLCALAVIILMPAAGISAADGDEKVVRIDDRKDMEMTLDEFRAWAENPASNDGKLHVADMLTDWKMDYSYISDGTIDLEPMLILRMKGFTITGNEKETFFLLKENGYLSVDGDGGIITKCGDTDQNGGFVDLDGDNGTLIIMDATLTGNTADEGGAIFVDGQRCTVQLIDTVITENYADDDGGAIFINDNKNKLELDNTIISENTSDNDGGGICTAYVGGETITITGKNDSAVEGNTCGDEGGGIYLGNDNITVTGLNIWANSAKYGGGIYTEEENIKISQCNIVNNHATDGGGIYVTNDLNTISGCTITNNTAVRGAGVYVKSYVDYDFTISGKTVIRNNNTYGEAPENVYISDDTSYINIKGLLKDSEIYFTFVNREPGDKVTRDGGSFDPQYLFCDNSNHHLEWNREDRNLYLRNGSSAPAAPKEEIAAGTVTVCDEQYNGWDKIKGYLTHGDSLDTTLDTDTCFYYSDGYFADNQNPNFYNTHLATTSLNFAMTSISTRSGGTEDYTGKHEAVRQFLADIGCNEQDIYVNDDYTQKPTDDSVGIAIAQKPLINNGEDTGYVLIPVVIRSAGYGAEWVSNAKFGTEGEAAGFAQSAGIAWEELDKYLKDHNLDKLANQGKLRFWIAGYSRGAAVANILAKRVVDTFVDPVVQRESNSQNRVYAYTWATPQCGYPSADYRSAKYNCIHNNLNYADLITLFPPTDMGFIRYGVDHYVPGSVTNNHSSDYEGTRNLADNKPLITKTNEYLNQRGNDDNEGMLQQLKYVDSTKFFDDYFHPAYISANPVNLLAGLSPIKESGRDTITAEVFLRDLIYTLQHYSTLDSGFRNRSAYANTLFTLNNTDYDTAENAAGNILKMIYGGEDYSSFASAAATVIDYIPVFDTSDNLSLQDIFDDMIGDWTQLTPAKKQIRIDGLMLRLEETGAMQYLKPDQEAALRKSLPVLLNTVLQFTDKDYSDESYRKQYGMSDSDRFAITGTAAYNLGRLIPNHYSEVYLAWARTFDDFYAEETAGVTIIRPQTLTAPEAVSKAADTEEQTVLTAGDTVNRLTGDQTVILNAPDYNGEAIYYTVENVNTGSVSGQQIYRGGINLTEGKDSDVRYIIRATAMEYDAKSSEIAYTVEISNRKIVIAEEAYNKQYGEDDFEIEYAFDGTGEITWESNDSGVIALNGNKAHINGIGTATVTATVKETEQYTKATVTVNVEKGTPRFTAPTAKENLFFNGKEQPLINAGTTAEGTVLLYSLSEKGEYGKEIPTASKAGNYEVWYKVDGGKCYNSVEPKAVSVTINRFHEQYEECSRDNTCPVNPFADTSNNAWWHDGIHFCLENNFMQGVSDTEFAPNNTMTRAMIVTVLWRAELCPVTAGESAFSDVPQGKWYSEAVCWAQNTGVVNGYGNGTFGPSDEITREQLVTILFRYAEYTGSDTTARADLSAFSDEKEISGWALESIQWANAAGLITGRTPDTIVPKGTASRAEAATILQRFLTK